MPTLLQVACALIPREKAAKISAEESDRSMHQFFPSSLSYSTPAVSCIISVDLFCYRLVLRTISLYLSAYLPKQSLGPLGVPWLSREIFCKAWFPLGERKLFLRPRPSFPFSAHTLCTGSGKGQFPVENYFSYILGRRVRKKWPLSN